MSRKPFDKNKKPVSSSTVSSPVDASSLAPGEKKPSLVRIESKPPHDTPVRRMARALEPGLHVIATPIGNAADITLRALDALRDADVIACEDTRMTAKLLSIHNIRTPMVAYHEHNAERARPMLIKRLKNGERVALVSDAGTPLISDPGYKLVRACYDDDIHVTALPGPSSVMTALVLSGLPTDRFLFAGFMPNKSTARKRELQEIGQIPATLVLMESAKRLARALSDMAEVLGPRPAVMAREMTKKFEEVRRGDLVSLAAHYAAEGPPRGEVCIVIGPPDANAATPGADELDALILGALKDGSVRDAADQVSIQTGVARRTVYGRALELSREQEQDPGSSPDSDSGSSPASDPGSRPASDKET